MEGAVTLDLILEAINAIKELKEQDENFNYSDLEAIKKALYYSDVTCDDDGEVISVTETPILLAVDERLQATNKNLENINLTLQYFFGFVLVCSCVFVLIKTFFTGW